MIAYYYRKGSLDGSELNNHDIKNYDYIFCDVADKFEEQTELQLLLTKLPNQPVHFENHRDIHKVVCKSLINLSSCSWTKMLILLRTITLHADLEIEECTRLDVKWLVKSIDDWENNKAFERQKLIASRSLVVGRPRKPINVTEALRLREEEHLTFKDIADRLNTNVAMVYREMPKHLKGRLDKGLRMRSRERVRRTELELRGE